MLGKGLVLAGVAVGGYAVVHSNVLPAKAHDAEAMGTIRTTLANATQTIKDNLHPLQEQCDQIVNTVMGKPAVEPARHAAHHRKRMAKGRPGESAAQYAASAAQYDADNSADFLNMGALQQGGKDGLTIAALQAEKGRSTAPAATPKAQAQAQAAPTPQAAAPTPPQGAYFPAPATVYAAPPQPQVVYAAPPPQVVYARPQQMVIVAAPPSPYTYGVSPVVAADTAAALNYPGPVGWGGGYPVVNFFNRVLGGGEWNRGPAPGYQQQDYRQLPIQSPMQRGGYHTNGGPRLKH